MSVQASIHSRKGIKIKKNLGSKQEASPINPEILTYIQKVQNDNDKSKVLNQTKNNMPIQVERIITNKLINTNISTGLNEDMTYDKDKRFTAKKGLLYLLNNLSNGTFCPDIEEYFSKMKEAKMEEFKHKSRLLDSNVQKSGEESDGKKRSNKKRNTREPTYKRLLNNMENNIEESQVNESKKNLFRKNDNSEIRDEIGIKKYEKDYDADDLKYLYDKKEIKDNLFQINYNKEKLYKMKLKRENMKSNNN